MNVVWIAVGGVAAHVLSLALAEYAQWLLTKVVRGADDFRFVEDLWLFVRWLLCGLAGQLHGRQGWEAEEPDWQPELYRN